MEDLRRREAVVELDEVEILGADARHLVGLLAAAFRVQVFTSGMTSSRSVQGSVVSTEARILTACPSRPRRFISFSDMSTAAAEPSTFAEHISFVFG